MRQGRFPFIAYGVVVFAFLAGTVVSVGLCDLRHDERYFQAVAAFTILVGSLLFGVFRRSRRDGFVALGVSLAVNAVFWSGMMAYWLRDWIFS